LRWCWFWIWRWRWGYPRLRHLCAPSESEIGIWRTTISESHIRIWRRSEICEDILWHIIDNRLDCKYFHSSS
jgi:hypothetical protein